jgi:predicted pyridoxine 5'-phosphate oxidase superfamily flavin-nucleotide-binding protein
MTDEPTRPSPFHAGEKAVQERCGVREQIERVGAVVIRDAMPLQHRQFFSRLMLIFAGHADAAGRPWASVLAGDVGFVHAIDARALRIDARPAPGDPLSDALADGLPVGLLGIDLSTRRRNRMNGVVSVSDASGFTVSVEQSFGNCPQYIQARAGEWTAAAPGLAPHATERLGARLEGEALAIVRRADTLFLASSSGPKHDDVGPAPRSAGADVSHRGGKPGFVRVRRGATGGNASVLVLPDFTGNFLFNTLGNLALHPRAGLLFVDFASGDLVQITGRAEVVWDGEELAGFEGAQRLVRITVDEGRRHVAALPLAWSEPDFARQLDDTGDWPETAS